MAARPSNSFRTLRGVEVLYDRLKPHHYGKTGIKYDFYCTLATEKALNAMMEDLLSRTEPKFGLAERILSAGAWVNKSGQHGHGRAFDLDAIHWGKVRFIANQQRDNKELYLAVQAMCHKYFGTVLGYNYNADHEDHLHIDIGRDVKFRETKSTTYFIQEALNNIFGQNVFLDGEYGPQTEEGLWETLKDLGIGGVESSVTNWQKFLDAACDRAVMLVMLGLEADTALAHSPTRAQTADEGKVKDDRDLDDMSDPASALEKEKAAHFNTAAIMATREDTGSIDVFYKPHKNWRVYPETSSGVERWYLDFAGRTRAYLGYKFAFQDTGFLGLARTSAGSEHVNYNYAAYKSEFGDWASFIYPTSRCESEAKFLVVNAWDSAALTLGFFQMAAHTGKHLSSLFKDLIEELPSEADQYFPELKLGHQLGLTGAQTNHIFAVNGTDKLDLDVPQIPSDGLSSKSWYRGRFMEFFNKRRNQLDADEVASTARWVAWLLSSSKAQDVCVRNAVAAAKATVRDVHEYILRENLSGYSNGLDGIDMSIVAAAMDVKHHGRRNRDRGQSTFESIADALTVADPMVRFSMIDTGWRQQRSARSVREIKMLRAEFYGKAYNAATQDFS